MAMDLNPENVDAVKSGELLFDIGGHWLQGGFALVMMFDFLNGKTITPAEANVKLKLLPLTKDLVPQFEKDFPGGVPAYNFKDHSRVYNPSAPAASFEMKYSTMPAAAAQPAQPAKRFKVVRNATAVIHDGHHVLRQKFHRYVLRESGHRFVDGVEARNPANEGDLAPDGAFGEQWLLVDHDALQVIELEKGKARPVFNIPLEGLEDAQIEPCVGDGLLRVTSRGQSQILMHFSNELTERFALAAHYLRQRAQEGAPEPWVGQGEADVELVADPAGQGKKERVDDQGEQAQGQDDQQAGKGLEWRPQDRIDQPKDKGQPDDIQPVAAVEDIFRQQNNGYIQRHSIDRPSNDKSHVSLL